MPVPWKSYGVNPGWLHADPGSEAAAEWGAEKTEPRGSDEGVARDDVFSYQKWGDNI